MWPCCCGFVYNLVTQISNLLLRLCHRFTLFFFFGVRILISRLKWFALCQITDLRQRLAESQKTVLELEAEREQRQRDYDKKLLLAKSKIENVQVRMQRRDAPCQTSGSTSSEKRRRAE